MIKHQKRGFTLIELLIVIGIIAILAAVVFVILRPQETFEDSRDARRWEDVRSILDAVHLHVVKEGSLPNESYWDVDNYYVIGTSSTGCNTTCTGQTTEIPCLNFTDLINNYYLAAIPVDPLSGSATNSDYYIFRNTGGVVEVGSCDPENASEIRVMR